MRVLGLMSGTSADGIDAVLVDFKGDPSKPKWKILNTYSCARNYILENNKAKKIFSFLSLPELKLAKTFGFIISILL